LKRETALMGGQMISPVRERPFNS
jgi:hypothetical protein